MGKSNEEDQHQNISPMPTVKIGNNKQFSDSEIVSAQTDHLADSAEMDHLAVQKGYLFMLEHIHEEPQLVCYLCHLCESPLSDDKKKDMRDGKGYFKKRELLKCLISKGESACKEFLEKFKCYQNLYSQFCNAVQSVTNADGIQQDVFLTHDKLPHFERVLLEEMEPTPVGDILYCHAVLSSDEHDEIDEMSNKREKAMKLLTKIGQQPDKIAVFCHALEQSKCSRAVEYIRNNPSNGPLHSSEMSAVKCVRFNFRKNLDYFEDCVRKKKLLDYLEINGCKVTSTGELVPKESYIIKTALRNGKPWCDCILECLKKTDFVFLKKLVGRLEKRRKDGREGVDLQFNVKMMKDMKEFLLDELVPARISHILLEEEAFSIDDHDEVENTIGRRKKVEALCGILLRDGSELTMDSFSYALRKDQYITNEIRRRESGQQPITQQRPTNQSDIQIRHIGQAPENVEEIQAASGLDVLMSIPVRDVEELQQTIDQLNINPDFHAEVLSSHVMVESISLGSVVLRLIALTDDACQMLFDENGKKMKTLIETFLRFSNIKEDMIKGNIEVTVSVPEEETGNKLPTDDEIKIRGNWNLLVEELEPSTMAKKLFEKHVFSEDDTKKILSMKTSKEKVETLLSLLLSKQREVKNAFDAFIRSLDELGKGDIAVKIKLSEKMHQEAEKVRLGLLSKFAEAVDEIDSSHMEETFELCGIDKHSVNFISSESGKSRKDRALQFLIYVLLNDAYVLGIEKVLNDRGLSWLLEYPKDRIFVDQLTGDKHKRTPGKVLYQCQYEVERKEMRKYHDIDGAVVRGLFVFLKKKLIFDPLLDGLIQRDILNKKDIEDYICHRGKCFRIERLIKRIIWKKRCSDFVAMINNMPGFEDIAKKIRDTKENTHLTVEDGIQGSHDLTINNEMLQKHFAYLYMKLEPREVAHILFQSGHISLDEHDEVTECNQKIGRLRSLLAILKKNNLYAHFLCTLKFLKYISVLDTLRKKEQLENHIGEYELCIQHNFILLQTELPDPDLAKEMMEHNLDESNISDIESCRGKTRQISKLLKILLTKGAASCKELLRIVEFDLKREKLVQRLKDNSTDKKRRGKPNLCSELRSLNISCLQEHEEVLLEELDPLHFSDLLFEEKAIEIIEHDTITEFEYRHLQITNLLKTVKENKYDCFHFFLYILQNEEYVCIREKLERPVPEASRAESSKHLKWRARHSLEKVPDDVRNELLEVQLTIESHDGSQVEQALQDIHSSSTGILEEAILHGQTDIVKVSKGSVVLQLRPLTDQAVQTLLNARENNRLVEMIIGMLQKANIAKITDGTIPVEIKVQVKYAKTEKSKSVNETSRTTLIKHRIKANKNFLVSELESTSLVSVLRHSKAFDKNAIEHSEKVDNNDERVKMLLSLVENGNSEVVEEFLTALKDLYYFHIVEVIDPPEIHRKAEFIREKITSNYKNILDEMQLTFAREVLSKCIGDVDGIAETILPKKGNRRKRMNSFLQFILQEDYNVIEFEKILKNNGLGDLLRMEEIIQREHTPAQDMEVTVVKNYIPSSKEEVLFESVITVSYSDIDKANKQNLGEVSRNTSVGDQKKDTERSQSHIDIQETHLQRSLWEHKMTPLSSVQKGYLFMLEHIHEELQLLDYLCQLCKSPLRDDEKKDMIDGKGFFKKREILKCLTSKGEIACREFLEKFKCYPNLYFQFRNAVQSVTNADGLLQDLALTNDGLLDYAEILLEEMEPSRMSDILFCYGLLNSAMHAEMDSRKLNRRQKAKILLDKTREQPDKMPVFCHALVKTECCRAIEYIRKGVNNILPPFRSDSLRCVTINFRELIKNLRDTKFRKEFLFQYMRRRGYFDHNTEPKECTLIKAGIRGRKPGCDCIWEWTRQQDLALLKKMFGLLYDRNAHPRLRKARSFGIEVLSEKKDLFLEELDPTSISHILLEEEAFSVDDHDAVNNKKRRREKIEALLDILKNDGSELTFDTFIFALSDNILIMNNLQPGAEVQTADHGSTENEIQVTEVGTPQRREATEMTSRLEVTVSIPVEGGEERIRQEVEQLNIDSNFKKEIAQHSHMTVERVDHDMGSVVLRLVAMTDHASERLLAKSGENVKKLVETFLKFSDLKEDMIKGNIKVTVLVPEEEIGSGDQTMASDKEIKVKEHWNMLVEELEPSILAKKLLEKGVLNDSNVTAINSENTRKGKVECLLKMLPTVKGIDAYGAHFESLHELRKSDIVEQIKPSENMHKEAEKVRYGLLSRLNEVIDEIESEIIEETFKQCGFLENPMDKVKSDMSKSRKERALNFLMSILVNDAYVLAFKNVLDSYKLNPLYELKMPIDESIFSKSPRTTRMHSKGEKLFECEYKVIREGEEVEDAHMTQDSPCSEMEWKSSSLIESKRQPDESEPKYFAPKERHVKLEPKSRSMYQTQAAVQPKRIFGRSGDDESKEEWWSVVVALDFGTTYSGYAFWRKDNDPLDITPGKWKTESKEGLESLKTPTSLLLNKENKIIEFGFEAEKIFKELVVDGNDEEYRFFRQFKTLLHDIKSFNMDILIEDHLHNPIKALDVFSLSIQYLKDECIELFQKKHINVANDEILWILTVPAIWDESAKQFMRKAAEQAEIPSDQLKLALEPEAAAIYVVKGAKTVFGKESVTTVKPGTKIMLADLGGGTADLTVLELNEDKTMKQLHRSFGGAWGGNLINENIWKIMTNVFGEEVIDEFKKLTADYIDMESNIELRKRDISTGSKLQLQILPSLADLCKTVKGKGYKQLITESGYTNVKVRTGKLSFEPGLVEEIFDLTLTNLYTSVRKVLDNPNMKGIKDIILVGGFAQADFIVKQFKERFSGYNVIIPTDPVLAVLKGAVMFGQDIDIISSRITPHTYGFDSMRHFTEGIDPRIKKRKRDNTFYCVDVFEKMVAIGDSVDVGKTVEKEVFASSKDMKSMVLQFYQSDKIDPKFVTDPGCEYIGKLSVEMPDLSGGTERSVMVSIKFGETEITVCGVDKTTGKTQETVLDLLGDT